MSKKLTAEEIAAAKIFEGCKHPELIDEYIRGVKDGVAQSRLKAIAEEVELRIDEIEKKMDNMSMENEGFYYLDCRVKEVGSILQIIQQHLQDLD